MAVWWDGDLLRELLDSTSISKWNWESHRESSLLAAHLHGAASNNSSKATPCLSADLLGDWREEVIWRSRSSPELLLFSSSIPTTHRIPSLMQDHVYRMGIAWQNAGYNQPAHTSTPLAPSPPR
jgi:rhamnogalacturonan endolyase